MDHTLLAYKDDFTIFDNLMVKTLEHFGLDVPKVDERYRLWGLGEKYPVLLEKWGVKDIRSFWKYFDKLDFNQRKDLFLKGRISPYENVEETLKTLKKREYFLAILSNSNLPITNFLLEKTGLKPYFEIIRGLDPIKTPTLVKPSPGNLLGLIKEAKFDREDFKNKIFMIGDSFSDILAAKRANIRSILINVWGQDLENNENFSDFTKNDVIIIESIDELISIFS